MGGPFHILLLELSQKIDDPVDGAVEYTAVLVVPELVYGAGLHSTIGAVRDGRVVMRRGLPGRRARDQRVAHSAACHRATISRVPLEKLLKMRGVFGSRAGTNGHITRSRETIRLVLDVIGVRRLIVGASCWGLALAGEVVLTHVLLYVSIGGQREFVIERYLQVRGSRVTR